MGGKELRVLGTSTVVKGFKTTIIKRVAQKLNLKEGDMIVYYEDKEGKVIIDKA